MAFTRIMLALLFNHLPHPSSSSQAKNSLRVPRMLAFLSYLVTAVFFFSSNLYSSLQTWIPIVFFIISAIPLLPLPALNLETRLKNMLLYAIFKSLGSFACNYLFNWIGSAIKMETDLLLMNASLSFAFFLIMIDYVYDIDEDVGLCDGFFFAGFGLMSSQKVIPQYLVLIVGSGLCLLRNFLHLSKKQSSGGIREAKVGDNDMEIARAVAILSCLISGVFFFCSEFFSSLPEGKTWIPIIFFIISAIPLFPLSPLNIEGRINGVLLYAIVKSVGSFACNYLFNWIGSAIKMETDLLLMNASLSFAFFLIMIDYVYDIDEDVGLCDGFFFAGFGLMSSQKVIPQYLVLIVGSSLCFLKTYLPLYKKQSSGGINEVEELAAKDSGDSGDVPAEDKGSVVFTVPGVSGEEATIRQRLVKKEQEMQEIQMQCKNIYTHADDIDF